MTVTQRRLRAVFLCAFVGAGIMLLVATASWVSVFAQINRAQAQSGLVCSSQFGTIDEVADSAGEYGLDFRVLSPVQADQYIAAILPSRPEGSEGLSAIVVSGEGGAALQMTQGGIACSPVLRVSPESHNRGMSAAMGQPA